MKFKKIRLVRKEKEKRVKITYHIDTIHNNSRTKKFSNREKKRQKKHLYVLIVVVEKKDYYLER